MSEISDLEAKKAEHCASEDFESAAAARDAIKKLADAPGPHEISEILARIGALRALIDSAAKCPEAGAVPGETDWGRGEVEELLKAFSADSGRSEEEFLARLDRLETLADRFGAALASDDKIAGCLAEAGANFSRIDQLAELELSKFAGLLRRFEAFSSGERAVITRSVRFTDYVSNLRILCEVVRKSVLPALAGSTLLESAALAEVDSLSPSRHLSLSPHPLLRDFFLLRETKTSVGVCRFCAGWFVKAPGVENKSRFCENLESRFRLEDKSRE